VPAVTWSGASRRWNDRRSPLPNDGEAAVTGEPGVGKTVLARCVGGAGPAARILRLPASSSGLTSHQRPAPPGSSCRMRPRLLPGRHCTTSTRHVDDLPGSTERARAQLSRRLAGSQSIDGCNGPACNSSIAGLPELEVPRLDDVAAGQLLDSLFPELALTFVNVFWSKHKETRSRCWSSGYRQGCADPPRRARLPLGLDQTLFESDHALRRGRGSSCCSWRSMARETCVFWRQ
jgi:hypothetical protein